MERDIIDYTMKYLDEENSFEKYQVLYRRKKVLERLNFYKHDNIVEIAAAWSQYLNIMETTNQ